MLKKLKVLTRCLVTLITITIFIRHLYRFYVNKFFKIQANNLIFKQSSWNCYQYNELNLLTNSNTDLSVVKKKIIFNIENWSIKQRWYLNYNINGKIKYSKISIRNYIKKLYCTTNPPKINNYNIPFIIVFFDNSEKFICLLDHFFFDGQIFVDFLNIVSNNNQTINWISYKYKPLISDLKLINYVFKNITWISRYKTRLALDIENSYLISKKISITNKHHHRYKIMALIFETIFKYIPFNKIRVAFTVGINDDSNLHNRIGIITRTIMKKKNLIEYENMFLNKLSKYSLEESLISYDLVRNFPIHNLRSNLNNSIDIICSSIRFFDTSDKNNYCKYSLSSFIGLGKVPIYINSITYSSELIISLKISTKSFNYKLFLKSESSAEIHHRFKNKYNFYKKKYYKLLNKHNNILKEKKKDIIK